MKRFINGAGLDVSSASIAAITTANQLWIAELYIIGDPDSSDSIKLTSWESPLYWNMYGEFTPANISHNALRSVIGLEVSQLEIDWYHPENLSFMSSQIAATIQKAYAGIYDNWPIRIWRAYMLTPGDVNTYGCIEIFGGRMGDINSADRKHLGFTVNSFLDVAKKKVPACVIQLSNTLIPSYGMTPPIGMTNIPRFEIITGSTEIELICDCIDPTHHIFEEGDLKNGFLVFEATNGALAKLWAGIQNNKPITIDGVSYNAILLYNRFPYPPSPGVDKVYISGASPVNSIDNEYYGFPYIPSPEASL